MNCRTYLGTDCDTEHQLLVATLKVRLAKRQSQHSMLPLNLEELKEEKAVQFAAEVTNRFTAFEAADDEVNPKDLRKGIKVVLLEVAEEMIGCVKSQKKTRWMYCVECPQYSICSKRSDNCARAGYFLHSTIPSVTCL